MAEQLGGRMVHAQKVRAQGHQRGEDRGHIRDEERAAEGDELMAGDVGLLPTEDGRLHGRPGARSSVAAMEEDEDTIGRVSKGGGKRAGVGGGAEATDEGENDHLEDLASGEDQLVEKVPALALVAAKVEDELVGVDLRQLQGHITNHTLEALHGGVLTELDGVGVETVAGGEQSSTSGERIGRLLRVSLLAGREALHAHESDGLQHDRAITGGAGSEVLRERHTTSPVEGAAAARLREVPPASNVLGRVVDRALVRVQGSRIAARAQADMAAGVGTQPRGAAADPAQTAGTTVIARLRLAREAKGEIGVMLRIRHNSLRHDVGAGRNIVDEPHTTGNPHGLSKALRKRERIGRGENKRGRKGHEGGE